MRTKRTALAVLLSVIVTAFLIGGCGGYSSSTVETAPPPQVAAADRIPVNSLEDLPTRSYPLEGSAMDLFTDSRRMESLRKTYRQDLESDLALYDIKDPATLRGMYGSLANLYMLDKQYEAAIATLNKVRALEEKESARLMNGSVTRAYVAALGKSGGVGTTGDRAKLDPAFEAALTAHIEAMPWDVVQDAVKAGKGRAEFMSESLIVGMIDSRLNPAAQAMGGLTGDMVSQLMGMRYAVDTVLPLNPIIARVYGKVIEANQVQKQDIWGEREVTLEPGAGHAPVVVGIWDSGVDVNVFGEQMWVNTDEIVDGQDTDANGFVDDVHGIAFDLDGNYTTDILHPLGDQENKLDKVYTYTQGFQDLIAAVDSREASAVRKHMAEMQPGEVGEFMTTLGFSGLYMHGTHVAGIGVRGNPYARILPARITFDYHPIPQAMDMETATRMAQSYVATSRYFRQAGVRCVNMSWGWTFREIEGGLEANGVGSGPEERAEMARKMINVLADGLKEAMVQSPQILFVTAAGNDDNDVEFDVVIPSSFDLPNLMVIGAVDQAGDPTSFTSGGRLVKIYANGFQVESTVPGGDTMKMSGTSMASPNVMNLAAKLFTLDPSLTATEVRKLIEDGAERNPDYPAIRLINPQASVALLGQ